MPRTRLLHVTYKSEVFKMHPTDLREYLSLITAGKSPRLCDHARSTGIKIIADLTNPQRSALNNQSQ
jgi:hypothetical protein